MKSIVFTVAALNLLAGAFILAPARGTNSLGVSQASLALLQGQSCPQQQVPTFTGTVRKSRDQFVLSDDSRKSSYELDDLQTASEFEGKKVKVTGTLDVTNSMICVQNIVPATD